MSILKTKESLQRMFEERRRQQEKKQKRQEHKQQTKQRLQAIYRHQDQILKKSLREERKKVMDNLSKLVKKRSQNVRKSPSYEFKIYRTEFIERDTAEDDLYQSIDELKEAELRGEGMINFEKWKEIVEKTKKELEL